MSVETLVCPHINPFNPFNGSGQELKDYVVIEHGRRRHTELGDPDLGGFTASDIQLDSDFTHPDLRVGNRIQLSSPVTETTYTFEVIEETSQPGKFHAELVRVGRDCQLDLPEEFRIDVILSRSNYDIVVTPRR